MFFLIMPMGLSQGFVTVALPFLLTKNGFPVALTAGIVAIGLSANLWRFVWGPIVDLSLSLHKWYWLSLLACIASLLLLCFIPFTVKGAALLSIIVFVSQVAATITLLPINGFMAKRVRENKKGAASGWYQAGNLAGTGLGGGAGLWLAAHYNITLAGIVLGVASILFALTILYIKDIPYRKDKTIMHEIKGMGKDILAMIKLPAALFVMILIVMPIGTGAMANLWSAVAKDWKTDADTVVLVTGLLCGGVSAVGCIAGGFIADRWGVWNAYLGSGAVCAFVTVLIAVLPYHPATYASGVLIYGFCTGLMYAAYTALIFFVIGKKHTATKYSLMSSLGNLPVVYMTTFNGWTHDKFGSGYMLTAEATAGIIFVIIFLVVLKQMRQKDMIPAIVE
ncbi:MFS transporter [Agriterribacter sp.]|uniref:MFS transporter n=1 Tax=Agriterribacter sp. TaxID=2821509 RepID=UPI002C67F024|nr:MFS transporter [Agriterribacter sp.]HRO46480.1 MFS transporter [Agriterribacter sp.]HRQ17379.1 MFS transporter [Agriterribacter sp.]